MTTKKNFKRNVVKKCSKKRSKKLNKLYNLSGGAIDIKIFIHTILGITSYINKNILESMESSDFDDIIEYLKTLQKDKNLEKEQNEIVNRYIGLFITMQNIQDNLQKYTYAKKNPNTKNISNNNRKKLEYFSDKSKKFLKDYLIYLEKLNNWTIQTFNVESENTTLKNSLLNKEGFKSFSNYYRSKVLKEQGKTESTPTTPTLADLSERLEAKGTGSSPTTSTPKILSIAEILAGSKMFSNKAAIHKGLNKPEPKKPTVRKLVFEKNLSSSSSTDPDPDESTESDDSEERPQLSLREMLEKRKKNQPVHVKQPSTKKNVGQGPVSSSSNVHHSSPHPLPPPPPPPGFIPPPPSTNTHHPISSNKSSNLSVVNKKSHTSLNPTRPNMAEMFALAQKKTLKHVNPAEHTPVLSHQNVLANAILKPKLKKGTVKSKVEDPKEPTELEKRLQAQSEKLAKQAAEAVEAAAKKKKEEKEEDNENEWNENENENENENYETESTSPPAQASPTLSNKQNKKLPKKKQPVPLTDAQKLAQKKAEELQNKLKNEMQKRRVKMKELSNEEYWKEKNNNVNLHPIIQKTYP